MKIVINAIRLNSAGGFRVGENILKSFEAENEHEDEILFLCCEASYSHVDTNKVKKIYIPDKYLKTIRWLSGQSWIRKQLKTHSPDILFNLCNTPIRTEIPQLLLLHWSYAVFDEDYIWKPMPWGDYLKRKLRLFLIKRSCGYIDHLTVQTETMKKRAENNFLKDIEISVIPSSLDLEVENGTETPDFEKNIKTFLFLSLYYYHKNHRILIEVAKLIKKENLNFQIQVTVDENKPDCNNFINLIEKYGLQNQIVNLGVIHSGKIDSVFDQVYATINPSFLESFGLTYLEAASKGKLVLASDLDFVRETMQDAAIFFDPFDAASILRAMKQATDESIYNAKVEKGLEIVREWPSWGEITLQYCELMHQIVEKRNN